MDNNYLPENDGGVWQWIFGKSVSSTVFFNPGSDDGYVGIAAPFPGRILPVDLANFGGELLCQADAFLCSVNDVSVTSTVEPRPRNIEIGAEMILKQKLRGQGMAFLVSGGSGTDCFTLVGLWHILRYMLVFENVMSFCTLAMQIGRM